MSDTSTELEQALRALLAGAPPEYVAVYLFGSHARGTARDDSDVDLAFWRVRSSAPTLDEQPYLYADQLSQALGRAVDLVELNQAPPDLVHEVLRDGRVVLDRDHDLRIQLEVRARQHYLDMRPWLLRYRGLRPDL